MNTQQPARWYHVVAVQIVGATIIALALLAATVHAADLPLAWDAPTHNMDSSVCTNLVLR